MGYLSPIMVGVPQAIEIVPEFVTGRQLYNYIYKHFKKTISNPITVQWSMMIMTPSKPR